MSFKARKSGYVCTRLGLLIQEARIAKDMSQAELGKAVGLSGRTLSDVERGRRLLRQDGDEIAKFSAALGIDPKQLRELATDPAKARQQPFEPERIQISLEEKDKDIMVEAGDLEFVSKIVQGAGSLPLPLVLDLIIRRARHVVTQT